MAALVAGSIALAFLVILARRLNVRRARFNWLERLSVSIGTLALWIASAAWLVCLMCVHAASQGRAGFGGSEIALTGGLAAVMLLAAAVFLGLVWLSDRFRTRVQRARSDRETRTTPSFRS